ncbi:MULTISPECIES: sugar MFS transporter [unclassified Lysobacter]|uniref:sugar MFS transporter n=1 Tax=unclassified Lysobacter TaxID=2635362 RepID=UPI001C21838C|nr:sugar MFS transporter [Lysobacter sp. MMG2]MBU8976906.1 sugar MFS transporter [Lysobacter sp. MMG2]
MSGRPLSTRTAIAVLTMIFFTWGALTSLNDVLIPHLKAVFEMNYAQTMLIQFTFFSTYLLMSVPAGKVVALAGYKRSIIIGLCVAGVGALLFFPAARIPSYPLFLFALFVLASGITLLQVSANPYIALLGDANSASSRLTLAQALNSFGHTIAPLLIGPLILSGVVIGATELAQMPEAQQAAYRISQAESVQLPYLGIAAGLFLLAVFVVLFRLPAHAEATESADHQRHTFAEVLRHRHLRFGVVGIFMYVGAEVAIGSFLINYISDPRIGALDEAAATEYVAWYWGLAMAGRFIGSFLLRRIEPRVLLGLFAIGAMGLLATTMLNEGRVAVWSVVAIGLFNSIMFPTIFTLGIHGLGPLTSKASSLLVMAIVGGAVVPLLQGVLADRIGVQMAFVLPLACYAFITWYGFRGARREALDEAPVPVASP